MKYKLKRGNVYYIEDCCFNSIFNRLMWLFNMKLNGWKVTLVKENGE